MTRVVHFAAIVAVALLLWSGRAQAQNSRAGFILGVNISNLGADTEQLFGVNAQTVTNLSGGGFFGLDVSRLVRLQLIGQYVRKGAKFEDEGIRITVTIPYIEFLLPVALLIPAGEGSITPRVYAGPSLAFESKCEAKGEAVGEPVLTRSCEGVGIPTKGVDYGVFFGGGVDFSVGAGEIALDVLYNLGLGNINDFEGDTEAIKNRTFQIMVAYAFLLGG